jgi:WD40 repeat protein
MCRLARVSAIATSKYCIFRYFFIKNPEEPIMSSNNKSRKLQPMRKSSHFVVLFPISLTVIIALGCNALPHLQQRSLQLQPVELPLQSETPNIEEISNLAISPDGNLLVANGQTEPLQLRHTSNGKPLLTLQEGHQAARVTAIAFSPDSKTLAGAVYSHQIILWDTQSGNIKQRLVGHRDWITALKFSPDSKMLASGSNDKTVKIWDIKTGKPQKTVQTFQAVKQIHFSPNSTMMQSADIAGTVQQWQVKTGQLNQKLANLQNKIAPGGMDYPVGFSANGKLMARADDDNAIRVWNLETGKLVLTFAGHHDRAKVVSFSPNSLLLATAGGSGEKGLLTGGNFHDLRLWDVQTGRLVAQSDKGQYIMSIVFAPHTKTLITGGDGGKVRLWSLSEVTSSP